MNKIKITETNLKTSELLALCRAKFPVWSYYDDARLDKDFPAPKSAKDATERYFLKEQEPDKETLGLSVNQAEAKGFKDGITLRERILLELAYFDETGNHLDVKGITWCSGSRCSDGRVPSAYWGGGEFRVGWGSLDYSDPESGVRSAVSLSPSSFNPSEELQKAIDLVKSHGFKVIQEK